MRPRIKFKNFAFLFFLQLATLFFAVATFADTEVGGNITEDTTWTKANSPYIVTSNVQVLEGVKLTIEQGVIVKFHTGTGLVIGGQLNAVGAENEMIVFTSNSETPSAGDWGEIKFVTSAISAIYNIDGAYLSGSIIKYSKIEYGSGIKCYDTAPYIVLNKIINNRKDGVINRVGDYIYKGGGIYYQGDDLIKIENNIISNNRTGSGGGLYIEGDSSTSGKAIIISNNIDNNWASGEGGGILNKAFHTVIGNNTLENNTADTYIGGGILNGGHYVEIKNNLIQSNTGTKGGGIFNYGRGCKIYKNDIKNNVSELDLAGGIYAQGRDPLIYMNNIESNLGGGILIDSDSPPEPCVIKYNNIINNYSSDELISIWVRIQAIGLDVSDIDAQNNYWGTTEASQINSQIHDYYDDITLPKVFYEPIATQPYDFSGGSISGIIIDNSSSQPVPNATISLDIGIQSTTNESGEYTFENISPGDYSITVSAPLYHSSNIENISILSGATTTLDVSLDPKTTGTVTGKTLSSAELTPISNVTIQISNGIDTLTDISDSNGIFSFDDITHGDYSIEITDTSYWDIPLTISVNIDQTTEISLVGIPHTTVDEIRNGWFTQEQLDQAVSDAEAAKDLIITEKDQIISTLNDDITQKEQTITALNATIASMFSKVQLDQAIADAEAVKDLIISDKDQIITDLNTTIKTMFTQEQFEQEVNDAIDIWDKNNDGLIGLEEIIYRLQILSGIRD